jgi:tetratricopeptide (TPR) repeat protein
MPSFRPSLIPCAAALVAGALVVPAHAAFIVDQVQVRRVGDDAVLELQFTTEVQFQRLIATAAGDTVIIDYQLVATTNREVGAGSQLLALDHLRGLDRVRLTDEPAQGDRERRVVVRLGAAGGVTARMGSDGRRLLIVLAGRGAGLAEAAAAAPAAPLASDARASELLFAARAQLAAGDPTRALESLNALLDLPPNAASQEAQELAGQAWAALGQPGRARAENETYLKLYPQGAGSDRVRQRLAGLPVTPAAPVEAPAAAEHKEEVTLTASTSMTWYGGNGKLRSQEFQDSPIAGLPPVIGEPQFNDDRTSQVFNDVDVNWRRRSAERDQRFVFRDAYTTDLERSDRSRNRLSSLYFDLRALKDGWGARLGRQLPTGGGVMGRFDGVQGYWMASRTFKIGAEVGVPAETLFDTRRYFYGVRADAERLIGNLGAGVFSIDQRIDGELDRRAVGLDLRWFDGGSSVFTQLDYDVAFSGLNVASIQGTHVTADNTVYTALFDRRVLTTLSLGNALTFEDPTRPGVIFKTMNERLANTTVDALRDQIHRITPMVTQAQVGFTRPLNPHWTTGASLQLTNTGAIPPVPDVPGFETGRPATGDIYSASAQLIGLNLLSERDTHVASLTAIRSPALDGVVVSYNNSSFLWQDWQVEPSLQFYRDRMPEGSTSERWTPGMRVTYRGWKRLALETALTYEIGSARRLTPDPAGGGLTVTTRESSNRASYSLGARLEF